MQEAELFQLSTSTALLLLVGFYGLTFLMSLLIGRKEENVDSYMVSNNAIGFGLSAASMIATWIWAASFYASATAGYTYGLSGPIHYGLWGALMILFIYPFGRRFRKMAPKAHTLAEVMHARHGKSSQLIMAGSNLVGSCISLMVNFTAAGALVSVLSPLTFIQCVLIAGIGVLSYTIWSGFRSSVMTDFAQLVAMILAAVVKSELAKLKEMITAQGGDGRVCDELAYLPHAAYKISVPAKKSGYVAKMDTTAIGYAAQNLGAGRKQKTDVIDPAVGLVMDVRLGDYVAVGGSPATLYLNKPALADAAIASMQAAIEIAQEKPVLPPLIYAAVSQDGVVRG